VSTFSARVLQWFDEHGRKDLPWQRDINPYRVWVSEIMLQQTQVQTVIPYYERFMRSFPDVQQLADADIDAVLQRWSGLGYYARARNLHQAAQMIRDAHAGVFPRAFDDVVALPGIGRSTAGAILAIARDEQHAILDGNVKRVLARHAAIAGWPGKADVVDRLWSLSTANTPSERVADYTQAIMDLGATLCTRSRPRCDECPVAADCAARLAGEVDLYPGRKPKKVKPLRQTIMIMAVSDGSVYLERRPPAGIWGGLWSLPEVENVDDWCAQMLDARPDAKENRAILRHSFSHYDLDIRPVVVRVASASRRVADSPDATWHPLHDEPPGGMAAPVQQLINTLKTKQHVTNR
jgi:A/G-specific adenine glycosylase